MKRFGPIWNPNIEEMEEVKTPRGRMCARCGIAIHTGDQGLWIPHVWDDHGEPRATYYPWHLDCLLESIGIEEIETTDE